MVSNSINGTFGIDEAAGPFLDSLFRRNHAVWDPNPGGYLCTKKEYENFKLVVEWRLPGRPGNRGVLMRITGEPAMLPNGVEAQLQSGSAGDMYGFQGFQIDGDKARRFDNPNAAGGLAGLKKIKANEHDPGRDH